MVVLSLKEELLDGLERNCVTSGSEFVGKEEIWFGGLDAFER